MAWVMHPIPLHCRFSHTHSQRSDWQSKSGHAGKKFTHLAIWTSGRLDFWAFGHLDIWTLTRALPSHYGETCRCHLIRCHIHALSHPVTTRDRARLSRYQNCLLQQRRWRGQRHTKPKTKERATARRTPHIPHVGVALIKLRHSQEYPQASRGILYSRQCIITTLYLESLRLEHSGISGWRAS